MLTVWKREHQCEYCPCDPFVGLAEINRIHIKEHWQRPQLGQNAHIRNGLEGLRSVDKGYSGHSAHGLVKSQYLPELMLVSKLHTLYGMDSRIVLNVLNPKSFKSKVKYWDIVAVDISDFG
jgi:hypothetical protein